MAEDIRAFVSALLAGERAEAMANLRARLAAGLAPGAAITHLILPALVEIGSRWERNEVAIYQEHLATETALQLLAGLAACAPAATALQRKALVSCAPNDHMQIVALALSVYLELRGWTACSLGQGLPAEQIVAAAAALRPDAVFLSLAMLARTAHIDVRQLSLSDLDPVRIWRNVDDRAHRGWTRAVKFYESLRFVYEIRSRLADLGAQEDVSESQSGAAQSGQPAAEPREPGPAK